VFRWHKSFLEGREQVEDEILCWKTFNGSFYQFLADKSIPAVPQPPYSSDFRPCDLFLFPWLKTHLKGRHFHTLENIQKSVTDELNGSSAEAFQHRYEQWKQRLRRCVAAQGNYFEGDTL
jgi:hypothetical protein